MNRIQDLWTAASLGNVPGLSGGSIPAFIDLFRSWLYDSNSANTSYETSTWAQSRRARAFYQYDGTSAGSGKGRRTAMWDAAGSASWSYDEYGRTTTATRVVDGRSYASTHTYDALDRAREMTYPDNETLTYSYQTNTFLDGIKSSIGNLDLVSDVVYKDMGLPVSYTLGSSPTTATQSFEYWKIDDTARSPFAAVKRIKLTEGETDLVNREMQYDAVGNVTKIVDGVNSETVDYTYDDLNGLLTASVPTGESFAYDTIGNMTTKSGATLDYGTTAPKHAVKSQGTTTYTYDANGSMTARGSQTIKYDPEQRPIRIQDGTNYYLSTYDGDGVRRKRQDSDGTVHYLGGYERKLADTYNSEVVTKYYSASLGAMIRPVAFRRGGTLHWVGADHLGGTIRVLDSSFAALDGMRYKPYGEDRDTGSSLNTDRKFTGQTEDEAAGLYWYASRAYDPAIGRFVSPDSIVPAPGNPQSLNRYSYVYNNPLKYTDPSGHQPGGDPATNHPSTWFSDLWVEAFKSEHGGADPTVNDFAYRFFTMAEQRGFFQHLSPSDQAAIQFNIPEGVDLAENIRIARGSGLSYRHALNSYLRAGPTFGHLAGTAIASFVTGENLSWVTRILPRFEVKLPRIGMWDYKRRLDDHEIYQDFGNFNFGVTGAARGFSEEDLLWGAGQAQRLTDDWRRSKGQPVDSSDRTSYGDQARDVAMIRLGYAFYTAMQRGR